MYTTSMTPKPWSFGVLNGFGVINPKPQTLNPEFHNGRIDGASGSTPVQSHSLVHRIP